MGEYADLDRMGECPVCRRPDRWMWLIVGSTVVCCGKCVQRHDAAKERERHQAFIEIVKMEAGDEE